MAIESSIVGVLSYAEARGHARDALQTAQRLGPLDSRGDAVLGAARAYFEWDWRGAITAFEKALRRNPNDADAHLHYAYYVLTPMDQFDRARDHAKLGVELDPLHQQNVNTLGLVLRSFRSPEAAGVYDRLLELSPGNPLYLLNALHANVLVGRLEEAAEFEDRVASLFEPPSEDTSGGAWGLHSRISYLWETGRPAEARALYERLEQNERATPAPRLFSAVAIGDLETAVRIATGVIEDRSAWVGRFGAPVVREALAGNPQFDALLEEVGLDRASIEELFPSES